MIKPSVKPVLDQGAGSMYNALQTVVFSSKDLMPYFAPFGELYLIDLKIY